MPCKQLFKATRGRQEFCELPWHGLTKKFLHEHRPVSVRRMAVPCQGPLRLLAFLWFSMWCRHTEKPVPGAKVSRRPNIGILTDGPGNPGMESSQGKWTGYRLANHRTLDLCRKTGHVTCRMPEIAGPAGRIFFAAFPKRHFPGRPGKGHINCRCLWSK